MHRSTKAEKRAWVVANWKLCQEGMKPGMTPETYSMLGAIKASGLWGKLNLADYFRSIGFHMSEARKRKEVE